MNERRNADDDALPTHPSVTGAAEEAELEAAAREQAAPSRVGGQRRDDAALNRHGRQSADDGGIEGAGLARRPPD